VWGLSTPLGIDSDFCILQNKTVLARDVPECDNIIANCFILMSQPTCSFESYLAIYREAPALDTSRVREPLGHFAEKWTELEWQALWYSGAFGPHSDFNDDEFRR
jgi:hypothetical protein